MKKTSSTLSSTASHLEKISKLDPEVSADIGLFIKEAHIALVFEAAREGFNKPNGECRFCEHPTYFIPREHKWQFAEDIQVLQSYPEYILVLAPDESYAAVFAYTSRRNIIPLRAITDESRVREILDCYEDVLLDSSDFFGINDF